MTTLAQLKGQVRAELGDTSATPLWPDERLTAWLGEALGAYEEVLPRRLGVDLVSVAGQAVYTLPADLLAVLSVEHPLGSWCASASLSASPDGAVRAFSVSGADLLLAPPPERSDDPIRVRYASRYPRPTLDSDVLATPPADDALLVQAIAARALRWLGTAEARALRYGRGATPPAAAPAGATAYESAFRAALEARRRGLRVARLSALGP